MLAVELGDQLLMDKIVEANRAHQCVFDLLLANPNRRQIAELFHRKSRNQAMDNQWIAGIVDVFVINRDEMCDLQKVLSSNMLILEILKSFLERKKLRYRAIT